MRVGGLEVGGPLFLAPMVGFTVSPVRRWALKLGLDLVHTEMVGVEGIVHRNPRSLEMLSCARGERPVVLQVFGSRVEAMAEGARVALRCHPFDAVSINMGCPARALVRSGAGAALMGSPIAFEMVRSLKFLGVPVWVKTRIFEERSKSFAFVEGLIEAGASLVVVHGRTPSQGYSRPADPAAVVELARAFPGMIGASGDVLSVERIGFYLEGGCACVLLARGFLRDPLLALKHKGRPSGQGELLCALVALAEEDPSPLGERSALEALKRVLCQALRGLPSAALYRDLISRARSRSEVRGMLSAFVGRLASDRVNTV